MNWNESFLPGHGHFVARVGNGATAKREPVRRRTCGNRRDCSGCSDKESTAAVVRIEGKHNWAYWYQSTINGLKYLDEKIRNAL